MYNACTCICTVWLGQCLWYVCTWYIPHQSTNILDWNSSFHQCMYLYIHSMTVYMQFMYKAHTTWSVHANTGFNQLSQQERSLRWAETRRRRKANWAWWEVKCACEAVQTCLYISTYIKDNSCSFMYHVHTLRYIYEPVCTMYIH
jgi:hypothetical protein